MASGTIYGSVGARGDSYSYYIDWAEDNIDVNSNTSRVKAWVHISCSNHSAYQNNCPQNLYINGVQFSSNVNINLSPGVNVELLYGETVITHNDDGTKTINISANGTLPYGNGWGPSSGSASADVNLDTIPRYAEFNGHRIDSIDLESVRIAYNSNKSLNYAESSLNGGSWKPLTIVSGVWNQPNNTVVYQITGLTANTNYNVQTRIAHISGLWKYSDKLNFKTKDYARITSVSSANFGESIPITLANLQGVSTKLTVKIGNIQICTRENLQEKYTLTFTQEELSNIVKLINGEETQITYVLTTNNKYTDTKTSTIILNSAIYIKVNEVWKKSSLYKKDNDQWKLSKLYIKVNNKWRNSV